MTDSKKTAFKCIIVLVLITVICCSLLAVLNDLLYVSSKERTDRVINSIYGTEMEYQTETVDQTKVNSSYGEVLEIYSLADGNKLYKTKGYNGFKNGTVSLWIVVGYENGTPDKITKVILAEFEKQTIMSKISGVYQTYVDVSKDSYTTGGIFTVDKEDTDNIYNIVTGATKSTNAANNAVNVLIDYVWGGK